MRTSSPPQGSNGSSSSSSSSSTGEMMADMMGITGNLELPTRANSMTPREDEGVWPCVSLVGNAELSPGPTRILPPLTQVPPPLLLTAALEPRAFPKEESDNGQGHAPPPPPPPTHLAAAAIPPTTTDETETSFTAKAPLSRTTGVYDVFEPHANGSVDDDDDGGDCERKDGARNSVGSADFSPIRRIRVKGNVETV